MINYIFDLAQRIWKMISDIQVAAIAVTIGAFGTKLCGDSF